jgi:hypothetical protein
LSHSSSLLAEFCTVLNSFCVECLCVFILFYFDAWNKVSTIFILYFKFLGFQIIETLNSSYWLLFHSLLTSISISIVHHTLTEVYEETMLVGFSTQIISTKLISMWPIPLNHAFHPTPPSDASNKAKVIATILVRAPIPVKCTYIILEEECNFEIRVLAFVPKS